MFEKLKQERNHCHLRFSAGYDLHSCCFSVLISLTLGRGLIICFIFKYGASLGYMALLNEYVLSFNFSQLSVSIQKLRQSMTEVEL
jgi:hypothetical protein